MIIDNVFFFYEIVNSISEEIISFAFSHMNFANLPKF